jgi:DNA-nicking Smr family endonuclease
MAKPRKTAVPDDDADAFREAMKDVMPLPGGDRVALPRKAPAPLPLKHLEDERQALRDSLSDAEPAQLDLDSGEVLNYRRDGVSPQVLRKLRAGHWAVQDEIDLHGLRSEQARALLSEFLAAALRRGLRCVRIVHGKGRGSPGGEPVLKRRVAAWLTQRGEVMAFCEARPAEGGSGAVLALLKARGTSPEARAGDGDDR